MAQSLARLQAHYGELERKYDLLLQEKRAISRKFSDHLKKWKNFKLWWLKDYERDKREAEADNGDSSDVHFIKRRQRDMDQDGDNGPAALNDLLTSAANVLREHGDGATDNIPIRAGSASLPTPSRSVAPSTTAFSSNRPASSGLPEMEATGEGIMLATKPSATQQPKSPNFGKGDEPLLNTMASGANEIVIFHDDMSFPAPYEAKSRGDALVGPLSLKTRLADDGSRPPATPVLDTSAPLKSTLEPYSSPAPAKGKQTRQFGSQLNLDMSVRAFY